MRKWMDDNIRWAAKASELAREQYLDGELTFEEMAKASQQFIDAITEKHPDLAPARHTAEDTDTYEPKQSS